MLSYYLKGAIEDLQSIINITLEDIEDIKKASHNTQFDRISIKDEKIKSFEQKKAMIDHEISNIMSENPSIELSQLLDEDQHKLLDSMKAHLYELKEINKKYSKLVLSVSVFYNSLLERVMPTQMQGYNKVAAQGSSFLTVRA